MQVTSPSAETLARPRSGTDRPDEPRYRGYFVAVDGLRGVAILSVLLYHTSWFSNGLFGVDVFMVLSGFLITLLLLREAQQHGRFRIGSFYVRRFKRLTPGLVFTLVAVVALGYLVGTLAEAEQLAWQAVAALCQVANWEEITHTQPYWTGFGQVNPLAHMWSLSITEQFYVVWPLLLAAVLWLTRRSSAATTVVLVLLLAASAAVAPLQYHGTNSDELYLSTLVRSVGFLAGAAAASVVHGVHLARARRGIQRPGPDEPAGRGGPGTVLLTLLSLVSLVALVAASVATSSYHEDWLYEGGIAAVAVVAATLAASLCHDRGPLVRLFSFGPLVEIGKMSYAMYLIHLPIYWLLLKAEPTIKPYALFLVGGLATWLGSLIVHYVVTERVRHLPWPALKAVPLLAVTCAFVVVGAQALPGYIKGRMNPGGKPVVLLLGDSVASNLATGLADDGSGRYAVVDDGVPGCGIMDSRKIEDATGLLVPVAEGCGAWSRTWTQDIGSSNPAVILVHVNWDATAQLVGNTWLTPCQPAYRARYQAKLEEAAALWKRLAPHAPVLLSDDRERNGAVPQQWGHCYDQIVKQFVATHAPQVHLFDLAAIMCPHGYCRTRTADGQPIFRDNVHFTPAGLKLVTPIVEQNIARVLG